MDSKFIRGQFVQVAGSTQEFEVATFEKTENDVVYTLRDDSGKETPGVSQAKITGLNKFNSESWTGVKGGVIAKLCPHAL